MGTPQPHILAIDQGTSSSRAVLFDLNGNEIRSASRTVESLFPQSGWVEQDPLHIWESVVQCVSAVVAGGKESIAAIGITNQRETIVCWDPKSGTPLCSAISWQCRRTTQICDQLKKANYESVIRKKTGLLLDPYFSATKIRWLIENNTVVAEAVRQKRAVFGTVDSWLIYNLCKDSNLEPVTEPSNASRTLLFSLDSGTWDQELMTLAGIEECHLPRIQPSWGQFGTAKLGGLQIPITAVLGDQQASLFGQGCFESGVAKCTFGTGAFLLMQTGADRAAPENGILETIAWHDGKSLQYALEGSIFIAGAAVSWLQEGLSLIGSPSEMEELAGRTSDSGGVILVPAFVGLGAPHWDAAARGAILGLTRGTNRSHIARAVLEGVAHQVADLTEAACFSRLSKLNIDGGMSVNQLFSQELSNLTGLPVVPSIYKEMTAFGAARAAALGAGLFGNTTEARVGFTGPLPKGGLQPVVTTVDISVREASRRRWKEAIKCVRSFGSS